ncbi:MAG TPA: DUF84 family protein [Candidatus Nitrosotenuis sp.]|nr:DUF84 family protein [Candidatus Nitrosotenuis sp.]
MKSLLFLVVIMGAIQSAIATDNSYQALYGPAQVVPAIQSYPDWIAKPSDSLPPVAKDILVIVTSDNPVKVAAAQALFKENSRFSHSKITFIPLKTKSGIAEQPLGIVYGRMGALNRIEDARKNPMIAHCLAQPHYFCSIENFFTSPKEVDACDHAYIIVASSYLLTYETVSDGIKIAKEVYQQALKEGDMESTGCSRTIGEYLHNKFGLDRKDWFKEVTQTQHTPGLTRHQQIVTTLQSRPWF